MNSEKLTWKQLQNQSLETLAHSDSWKDWVNSKSFFELSSLVTKSVFRVSKFNDSGIWYLVVVKHFKHFTAVNKRFIDVN